MIRRRNDQGFTLVEMLVALAIFGVLSVAGTAVISMGLRADEVVGEAEDRLRQLQIARSLMRSDFAHISSRPMRDPYGGEPGPSFVGGEGLEDGVLIRFLRHGWSNPSALEARSDLLQVTYLVEDDVLIRRTLARPDGTPQTPVEDRVLLTGIKSASLSFLAGDVWSEIWVGGASTLARMPDAIAVDLETEEWGPLRQLFPTAGFRQ